VALIFQSEVGASRFALSAASLALKKGVMGIEMHGGGE
jgi:hypothetical protein